MGKGSTYHVRFHKVIGDLSIDSHGGGWPRGVIIANRYDALNLTYTQARDLHYALGRLIIEIGEECGHG